MSSKFRSLIRAVAVILVILGVLMQLDILMLDALDVYRFWLVVIAFGLLLVTTR